MNIHNISRGFMSEPSIQAQPAASAFGDGILQRMKNVVVMSRSVFRFQVFTPPSSLNKRDAARAAWLYADAHAPFSKTASLLINRGENIEIWYWDIGKMPQVIGGRDSARFQFIPETILQPAGNGWRQVRLASGFEAQYWAQGRLVASLWRRSQFTRAQWRLFVLSAPESAIAPEDAPEPLELKPTPAEDFSRKIMVRDPEWKMTERAGISIAACALVFAALFAGQCLRISMADSSIATPVAHATKMDVERARSSLRVLQTIARSAQSYDPLMSIVHARRIAHAFGAEPSAWRVDANGIELEFDANAMGGTPDMLAAAYEFSKEFKDVVPKNRNDGGLTIFARLERAP